MTWVGLIWPGLVWYVSAWSDMTWLVSDVTTFGLIWPGLVWWTRLGLISPNLVYNVTMLSQIWPGLVWYDPTLPNMIDRLVWYDLARSNMIQLSVIWSNLAVKLRNILLISYTEPETFSNGIKNFFERDQKLFCHLIYTGPTTFFLFS